MVRILIGWVLGGLLNIAGVRIGAIGWSIGWGALIGRLLIVGLLVHVSDLVEQAVTGCKLQ